MKKIDTKKLVIPIILLVGVIGLGSTVAFVLYLNQSIQNESAGTRGPLFPMDSEGRPVTPAAQGGPDGGEVDTVTPGMRPALWRVTDQPVAAAIAHQMPDPTTDELMWLIRYVERETMYVFDHNALLRDTTRLSITNVPRIQEGFFFPGRPNEFVIRYLDSSAQSIQTYRATLTEREGGGSGASRENTYGINGFFLEQDVTSIAPSQDGRLAYLARDGANTAVRIAQTDGSTETVRRTPLRDIALTWPRSDTLLLATRPAFNHLGSLSRIATASGAERTIMMKQPALIASMNVSGDRLLVFTNSTDTKARLAIHNVNGAHRFDLPLVTTPEKCVWSTVSENVLYCAVPATIPSTDFPDAWYQGTVHSKDIIWMIDTETRATTYLASHEDFEREGAPEGIDAVNLALSADDAFMTFIDRRTDDLWALRLYTPEL